MHSTFQGEPLFQAMNKQIIHKEMMNQIQSTYNNNNEYLEHLTCTGPKRLCVLYKYILSKFNAYNMNAHTHRLARAHTQTHSLHH